MKQIPLCRHDGTIRAHALVDDADYVWLRKWRWHLTSRGYAERSEYLGGGHKGVIAKIKMHRQILDLTDSLIHTDHINRNRLDCRRSNLRLANDNTDNQQNLGLRADSTSGYRGVSWGKHVGKWRAYANLGGRRHYLGWYTTAAEADQIVKAFRAEHMPFSSDHPSSVAGTCPGSV